MEFLSTWLRIALIYIVSKAWQCIFIYWGHSQRGPAPPGSWEGVDNWLLNPWTTYDSYWFLDIALYGYREVSAVFFPFYPLLLRLLGDTLMTQAIAGIIISNIAFIFALYILYRLTRLDYSESISWSTLWIVAYFPTAAFFGAVYTESLFLLLLVITFYCIRKSKWFLLGLSGGLIGVTRNPAPVVLVSLIVEYLHLINWDIKRLRMLQVAAISMVGISFFSYLTYLYWILGNPLLSVTSQTHFYRAPAWPWVALYKDALNIITVHTPDIVTLLNFLAVILTFYFVIRWRKASRPSYLILIVGVMLLHLINPRIPEPHTIGALRYVSVLFPFLQMIALSYERLVIHFKITKYTKYFLILTYIYINGVFSYVFGLKGFLG